MFQPGTTTSGISLSISLFPILSSEGIILCSSHLVQSMWLSAAIPMQRLENRIARGSVKKRLIRCPAAASLSAWRRRLQ
jgi:hypothetical protein